MREDPLWEGSRVPHLCQAWWRPMSLWKVMTVLTKIFYCSSTENELKSYQNKTYRANFVLMQDSWPQLKLNNSHNVQNQWPVVSTHCQENKLSEPKGWIRGNTKIGPILEVTTCCLQCKYGMEIVNWFYDQGPFSLVGQNFSWLEQIGHGLEQQWARNLRIPVRRLFVEIECTCFCEPIKDILKKELGPILNHHNFCSLTIQCRRN